MMKPFLIDHLLFILFGVLFPLQSIFRVQPLLKTVGEWDTRMKISFYRGNSLMLWSTALVVMGVWLLCGRSLSGLGFRLPLPGTWSDSLLLAGLFLAAYSVDAWLEVATRAARARTREQWQATAPFLPQTRSELQAFNSLALSAAVGEEIIFRGYFLRYLTSFCGTTIGAQALALAIATAIFAFSHFYQGWRAIAKIGILSLPFGLIFLVTQSLLLPILLHFIVDAAGGWMSYRLMKE